MQSECISRAMVFQKFPDTVSPSTFLRYLPPSALPPVDDLALRRTRDRGIFAWKGRKRDSPVFRMERLGSGDNKPPARFVYRTSPDYRAPSRIGALARERLNSFPSARGAVRKPVKG